MIALAIGSAVLLALIWIGYPLLMRGLASLTARPRAIEPGVWPAVTAVIASREPAAAILERVDDVLAGDYSGALNVVVALDPTSPTRDADLAAQRPGLSVVRGDPPGGKATTLNAGARAATGEILVFTDTHQRFAPDAIRALVADLLDGTFAATSGRLELPERKEASLIDHYWRMERRLRRDEAVIHSAIGVSGSIYAMRRAEWEPLPAGLILDDLYVPMRLVLGGRRVGFTDAARASDIRRTAPAEEYRRKVRTLTGNFQLCAWMPAVLVPLKNPVWAQFTLHKLLRLITPYLILALGVGIAGVVHQRSGWSGLLVFAAVPVAGLMIASAAGKARRLVKAALWAVVMQASIVTATLNGLRGKWDVWGKGT